MRPQIYLATALLLLCLSMNKTANAQTTGSYDTTISFLSGTRAMAVYVPTSYTAGTPHKLMVCLHGLGDTCTNYRNALIGTLTWNTNMPNTIYVCPEASSRNADYYFPTGAEGIIQASIDYAKSLYNIDTNEIILQGFSLGGRAALRYGLDNYGKFKALLLNTPAIQGVKQALSGTAYPFNYANAKKIPVYMTHGGTDQLYTGPIDTAYMNLMLNDCPAILRRYPTMGHTIPAFSSMSDFPAFATEPRAAGADLHVVTPVVASRVCSTTVPAQCLVRNTGTDTINTITLNYSTGSGSMTHTWTGSMPPYGHTFITLPALSLTAGTSTLSVSVGTVNGTADTITGNNSATASIQVQNTGAPLPYFEGFEGAFPPANWTHVKQGDAYAQFDLDDVVKKTGNASMFAFNTILLFDNAERKDEMLLPVLNLTTGSDPYMSFDVAYNYHRYTPPYLTVDTLFADTLSVMVSTDCGATYTTVYEKGGAQLATYSDPIMNPTSVTATYGTPASGNWRTENISLNAYAGSADVMLKIEYRSALGGWLNVDNVRVGTGAVSVQEIGQNKAVIFPNPASDLLNISTGQAIDNVTITDMTGRMVMSLNEVKSTRVTIPTTDLTNGMYLVSISTAGNVETGNVIIHHK